MKKFIEIDGLDVEGKSLVAVDKIVELYRLEDVHNIKMYGSLLIVTDVGAEASGYALSEREYTRIYTMLKGLVND